jgi:hypothetical protein
MHGVRRFLVTGGVERGAVRRQLREGSSRFNKSGSLAKLTAMRRASSSVKVPACRATFGSARP